jgi:uncharacterized protein YwqG
MQRQTPMAWPGSREDMLASLQEAGLAPDLARHLAEQALPALVLDTAEADEAQIPIGASKIGGLPDLPLDLAWPHRPPYENAAERARAHRAEAERLASEASRPGSWLTPEQARLASHERADLADAVETPFPLAFMAQLDLASLSREPGFPSLLPDHGRLLFFCDYWERPPGFDPFTAAGFRLIWDRTPVEQLERKSAPSALAAIAHQKWNSLFKPMRVTPRSVFTAIPLGDRNFDAFPHGPDAPTIWDEDSDEIRYEEWLARFGTPDGKGGSNHRLGGWPTPLRPGMQATAKLATHGIYCGTGDAFRTAQARRLLRTAHRWHLLLQIGRDDAAGLLPTGCLYILMREQDMRSRTFDKAWMVYQSD